MAICQSCTNKWSWKQTLKSSFVLDTALKCPFCGSKQYLTAKTRKRISLSTFVILLPMLLPIFGVSHILSIILIFILGALVLLLSPLFTELTNEEPTLGKK